jgi:hypothetical protein
MKSLTKIDLRQLEESAWRECCFIDEARDADGHLIAWQPPKFAGDSMANFIAQNMFGSAAAADFVSHLRQPSMFDEKDKLTEVVEAMTGVKLGPTESSFLRGIASFISIGRIDATAWFDLVPYGLPGEKRTPPEGGSA